MYNLEGNTKYHKWYNNIISNRIVNKPQGYYETHHILPKCLGGSDAADNLIKLTAREHYICHLLLVKMFETNKSVIFRLIKAFIMMSTCASNNQFRETRFNSKTYSNLKERLSVLLSDQLKGKNNPQWNTIWIFHPELKVNKKIETTKIIPEGWYSGRVLNWDIFFAKIEKKKTPKKKQIKEAKPSKGNKKVNLIKQLLTINCVGCNRDFNTTNIRKNCCSKECYNRSKYNNDSLITITKNNKTKLIKPVNFPAYKKYKWVKVTEI